MRHKINKEPEMKTYSIPVIDKHKHSAGFLKLWKFMMKKRYTIRPVYIKGVKVWMCGRVY